MGGKNAPKAAGSEWAFTSKDRAISATSSGAGVHFIFVNSPDSSHTSPNQIGFPLLSKGVKLKEGQGFH